METKMNLTSNTTEMVSISRTEYESLISAKDELAETKEMLNWLMEQVKLLKKDKFGQSSEKSSAEEYAQLSLLFNEAELFYDPEMPEFVEEVEVSAHKRAVKKTYMLNCLPENVAVDTHYHSLKEADRTCPICGSVMEKIGQEEKLSLVIIPRQVRVRKDVYYTYGCKTCKEEGTEVPIEKTPKDESLIKGSHASPEAVAYLMTQKFVMYSPLYRMEQEFSRDGIQLSRQTMSNWMITCAEDYLKPIWNRLHEKLLEREVLHADETTLEVLKPTQRDTPKKTYMWLYRTSGDAEHPIVLYDYQEDRKAEHPKSFLKGFRGYLHADGYDGYHNLQEEIIVVGCLAHARRNFNDALCVLPKEQQAGSTANEALAYFAKLFTVENKIDETATYEERYKIRLEKEKPILDALYAWAEKKSAAPKSNLGKALTYLKGQKEYLYGCFEDGRLELTNNRAERSIKPFVMARKNFLFCKTPRGAQASGIIFSLIETAKENNLDPYSYLKYIFEYAPILIETDKDWVEKLLPENIPENYKTKREEERASVQD